MVRTPDQSPLERQLRKAGDAIRYANDERSAAAELLRRAVINASGHGWGATRIARAAGVSRQTVHAALRDSRQTP